MAEKLPKPVIIGNFQKGIQQGPFVEGLSDCRNLDIQTQPGSAKLNFQMQSAINFGTPISATFTVNTSTGVLTLSQSFRNSAPWLSSASGRLVTVSSSGSLPTGLVANTYYYILDLSPTTVQLGLSNGTGLAGFGSAGTGTLTITSMQMTLPKHMVYSDVNSTYYLQDDTGQLWTAASFNLLYWIPLGGTDSSTFFNLLHPADSYPYGQGLVIFKNYLLAFTNGHIQTYGLLSAANKTWSTTLNIADCDSPDQDHAVYYSPINDIVYWGEYDYTQNGPCGLGSLLQIPGQTFNPATGGTFTLQTSAGSGFALQLPNFYIPTCMKLVGANLYIGTIKNLIFLWDTHSATYSIPVYLTESNTTAIENIGNFVYIACGARGNIYMFNGYYAQKVRQVPPYLSRFPTNTILIRNLIKHNDRLYFTVDSSVCGGVWSFNSNSETATIVFENSVSLGTNNLVRVGLLFVVYNSNYPLIQSTEQLFVGYEADGVIYGLDVQPGNNYHSTSGYMETCFFNIGTPNKPRRLENCDIMLGNKLATGQSIQIFSRGDTTTSYSGTADATFDYTTYGAVDSIKLPYGKEFINAQFKVVVNTPASSTSTPQLNEIQIL